MIWHSDGWLKTSIFIEFVTKLNVYFILLSNHSVICCFHPLQCHSITVHRAMVYFSQQRKIAMVYVLDFSVVLKISKNFSWENRFEIKRCWHWNYGETKFVVVMPCHAEYSKWALTSMSVLILIRRLSSLNRNSLQCDTWWFYRYFLTVDLKVSKTFYLCTIDYSISYDEIFGNINCT